jgi:hypothetical protein
MRQEATERFRAALTRAVAHLGGDRAAEKASGVGKSVWYDAKSGRAVPDYRSTWPAMLAVLSGIPTASTYTESCALSEDGGRGRISRPQSLIRPQSG